MKLKILLLFILGCGTTFQLVAQSSYLDSLATSRPTGLIMDDDEAYKDAKTLEPPGSKVLMPPRVSLYRYCPIPRDQGKIQSCVGWATGYAAFTIEMARKNKMDQHKGGRRFISDWAFSALFLFNQIRNQNTNCMREGSKISDALEFLEKTGNCLARNFDINVEDCGRQPESKDLQEARGFKIIDHLKLFPLDETPDKKIFKTKYALYKGKAVIIGMKIRKNFMTLGPNASFWWPDLGDATPMGGHAMCVVGYDDNYKGQGGAFLLMNSWGTGWGQNGFMWVKYDIFAEYVKYAYVLNVDEEETLDKFWEEAEYEPEAAAGGGIVMYNPNQRPPSNQPNMNNPIRRPPPNQPTTNNPIRRPPPNQTTTDNPIRRPPPNQTTTDNPNRRPPNQSGNEVNAGNTTKTDPPPVTTPAEPDRVPPVNSNTQPVEQPVEQPAESVEQPEASTEEYTPPPPATVANRTRAKPLRILRGAFSFKYNEQRNSLYFFKSEVEQQSFYYQLKRKDWKVGQQFQLEVSNKQRNSYIYVFSMNPEGKIMLHWPRQEAFSEKFAGMNESGFSLEDEFTFIVPGKNRVLKISKPGVDHLVILFSKKPIEGLHHLFAAIEGDKTDLPKKLVEVLGEHMIPLTDIVYDPNDISFEVNTRSEANIVPLILEVQSIE